MSLLSRAELEFLMEEHEGSCVTIYMPTERKGPDVLQNPIRLKNHLDEAEERLIAEGMRSPEARALLQPARDLLGDSPFWQHQSDGLAVFLTRGEARYYRLPVPFEDRVVTGTRFLVKPLLPVLAADERFFILALSQDEVRLLQGTRYSVAPVALEGVPLSLGEALKFEETEGFSQVYRPGVPKGPTQAGVTMIQGHGVLGGANEPKDLVERFLQRVDDGLSRLLADERSPVVLAGVDSILAMFRRTTSLCCLAEEGIVGSPETLSPKELHARAWKIVYPLLDQQRREDYARAEQLLGQGRGMATADVGEAAIAAYEGRVDVLFVATTLERWGRLDADAHAVQLEEGPGPGLQDLLDLATVHTLLNGGTVHAVVPGMVPGGGALVAVVRYATHQAGR